MGSINKIHFNREYRMSSAYQTTFENYVENAMPWTDLGWRKNVNKTMDAIARFKKKKRRKQF